jgi:hypothetical protein
MGDRNRLFTDAEDEALQEGKHNMQPTLDLVWKIDKYANPNEKVLMQKFTCKHCMQHEWVRIPTVKEL